MTATESPKMKRRKLENMAQVEMLGKLGSEAALVELTESLFRARQAEHLHSVLVTVDDVLLASETFGKMYARNISSQLPGTLIGVWKILLNEVSCEPVKSSVFSILISFLKHFPIQHRIPHNIKTQVSDMIFSTASKITELLQGNVANVSFELVIAFSHLKMLFHYYQSEFKETDEEKSNDLSFLTGINYSWKSFLKSTDFQAEKMQLMKLHLSFLNVFDQTSSILKTKKKVTKKIVKLMLENEELVSPDNLDEMITYLSSKKLKKATDILMTRLHKSKKTSKSSENLLNSLPFQTSVITSFLNILLSSSKSTNFRQILSFLVSDNIDWIECSSTTPLVGGNAWTSVKEAGKLVTCNEVIDMKSKTIRLFSHLETLVVLQSLTPVNQCRLAVILLYIMINSSLENEVNQVATKMFLKCMQSQRSIWIFDMVSPSPILNYLIKHPASDDGDLLIGLILHRVIHMIHHGKYSLENILDTENGNSLTSFRLWTSFIKSLNTFKTFKIPVELSMAAETASRKVLTIMSSLDISDDLRIKCINELLILNKKVTNKMDLRPIVQPIWSCLPQVTDDLEMIKFVSIVHSLSIVEGSFEVVKRMIHGMLSPEIDSKKRKRTELVTIDKRILLENLINSCKEDELEVIFTSIMSTFVQHPATIQAMTAILQTSSTIMNDEDKLVQLLLAIMSKVLSVRSDTSRHLLYIQSSLDLTKQIIRSQKLSTQNFRLAFDVLSLSIPAATEVSPNHHPIIQSGLKLLNEMLSAHKTSSSLSLPVFSGATVNLLKLVVKLSSTELTNEDASQAEKSCQCFERLACSISSFEDFRSCAPTIFSVYVTAAKDSAIDHRLKGLLTTSAFRLLKSCKEREKDELERLFMLQDSAGKVLWRYLTDNYDRYYRYKGYV